MRFRFSESLALLLFTKLKWTCCIFLLDAMQFLMLLLGLYIRRIWFKSFVVPCYTCLCISFVLNVSAQTDLSIHLFPFGTFVADRLGEDFKSNHDLISAVSLAGTQCFLFLVIFSQFTWQHTAVLVAPNWLCYYCK